MKNNSSLKGMQEEYDDVEWKLLLLLQDIKHTVFTTPSILALKRKKAVKLNKIRIKLKNAILQEH